MDYLTASVASYLGLPDLYDTETGLSAIGRFGLMDGQAIFGYNGIYPPEPSPWSKIYLGWANPVTVSPGNFNINLVTKLAASASDTVILKVPLNSSEYYLIENRSRDANHDGSKLTYEVGGNTYTRTFTKDTTGYYYYSVDSVYGVVKDVDEFDWAVPGSGIVIWHIDDNVINQKIAENKINTDKTDRGVDVEEADGVQDIGEIFTDILGDQVVGEGTSEDLWYKTNPADLYQNKFSKDTRPNTNTNSGANSLITISKFSDISNNMSFNISYGDSIVKPIFSKNLNLNGHVQHLNVLRNESGNNFALLNNNNLIINDNQGNYVSGINSFSNVKTAFISVENTNYVVGGNDSLLNVYMYNSTDNFTSSQLIYHNITSPPLISSNNAGQNVILVGTEDGFILKYTLGNLPASQPQITDSTLIDSKLRITKISTDGNYYSVIGELNSASVPPVPTNSKLFYDSENNYFEFNDETPVDLASTIDKDGNYVNIILSNKNKFYVIKGKDILSSWQADANAQISSFGLTDLLQNGNNYIVYCVGNYIKAVNISGAEADNFPFEDPLDIGFVGTPLLADFEGNGNSEIIASTRDGRIFAVDGGTGKVINGFPISSGVSLSSTPSLFVDSSDISLAAVNGDNNFSAWRIGLTSGKEYWSEENGNNKNNAFIEAAASTNFINDFFPKDRAYNYPNPVYDNTTNIHYYVSENSKINIKIFDIAGDYVAELNDYAQGGLDHETVWNVSGIQSGIYFAHIEAESSSGKKQAQIIKIAVVK